MDVSIISKVSNDILLIQRKILVNIGQAIWLKSLQAHATELIINLTASLVQQICGAIKQENC